MFLIYGKGKVGSGIKKLLTYLNIPNTIIDDKDIEDNNFNINQIKNFKYIIPSPGIKPTHFIYKFKEKILGELDLIHYILTEKLNFKEKNYYYEKENKKIYFIGITGTDGKSTTTWKIYNIFKYLNRINIDLYIGGNFDIPLSELLLNFLNKKNKKEKNIFILEISSFMAYNLKNLKFIGSIWTNFDQDHLDWHKNLQEYFDSKKKLFKNSKIQYPSKILLQKKYKFFKTKYITPFIKQLFKQLNIRSNINLTYIYKKIPSLPHRLEKVGKIKNTIIINDGKCTTKNCLEYALKKLNGKIILISGGFDKGIDYNDICNLLKEKVIYGILFGQIKNKLEKIFKEKNIPYKSFNNFEKAIKESINITKKLNPTYLLFSPGASSFDMFDNRKQRATKFNKIISTEIKI